MKKSQEEIDSTFYLSRNQAQARLDFTLLDSHGRPVAPSPPPAPGLGGDNFVIAVLCGGEEEER